MNALIRKAEQQVIRRRVEDTDQLTRSVQRCLVQHLQDRGVLQHGRFDEMICHGTTLRDISAPAVERFIMRGRNEGRLALQPGGARLTALTGLNLLRDGKPTNASILLFGANPQRFIPAAEIKCLHFHGSTVVKPVPSYQLLRGSLFEQLENSTDFVMAKLSRTVGTRDVGPTAPVAYELPRAVVAEAIVNAVAHRDYASAASIQVYVFADRVEVRNPGELPSSLTPDSLRQTHASVPRNPLISDLLFRAHYVEKVGTGTLDMIAGCRAAGLPEPDFRQEGDEFVVRIWRDWLTANILAGLDLNERQRQAVDYLKVARRIANADYQRLTASTKKTASRDLDDLRAKGIIDKVGTTGRGVYYVLARKGDLKETKGT
jgi:predicted HTH transcriptional regulator